MNNPLVWPVIMFVTGFLFTHYILIPYVLGP